MGFIYTLHLTLPVYINSSYLGLYANEQVIGYLYIAAAVLTIISIFCIEHVIETLGNYKATMYLIIAQILLFYGLMSSNSLWSVGLFFVLSSAVVALIGINLDIFLQKNSDVGHTGGIRGLYMTINNTAWVLAPLIGGALIIGTQYKNVYGVALSLLFVLLYLLVKHFKHFKDAKYQRSSSLKVTLIHLLGNDDLSKLFAANIILNTFYAWMVIYSPIYLRETIHLNWNEIGVILTIMLLPFVIFQLPAGRLADRGWGEKKLMSLGFLLIGLSTICLAFITTQSFLVWAVALFITRIGASVAEVMIEAYFFKKVSPEKAEVLGIFRVTRYIAYIIAPAITAVGLMNTTSSNLFIILGLIVLWALRYTLTLKDIK